MVYHARNLSKEFTTLSNTMGSLLLLMFSFSPTFLSAQTLTVNATDGSYQVHIEVEPTAISRQMTVCPWGYQYKVEYSYNITFSGNTTMANLYTLQGEFTCNDGSENDELSFTLPNAGGNGTLLSSNDYRDQDNCQTATPELLGCNSLVIEIEGVKIPRQFIPVTDLLPIELLSFTVELKSASVELTWITASEQNNDYFTIERSADGVVWETVETLPGAGDSYENLMYQTVDRSPLPGQSYYRLKQTDFDGQFSYSDIKPVSIGAVAAQQMQLFPNPTNGQITMDGVSGGIKSIAIFNALGQRVDTQILISAQSDTRLLVDMSTLPSGIYTVNADGVARKFFKQ